MRLARLDLIRFGHFTDRTIELPKGELDLHLIVGGNEAGKSTLRRAILNLLYAFPIRAEYDFKHALPTLLLGARLEDGDALVEILRHKRNKNPLTTRDGEALSEGVLTRWLGGTDRDSFERNFALDYATLVQGAKDTLESSGDMGQMLFQAAAGLSGVHKVRAALDAEATALWGPRQRGDASYYQARSKFEAATQALKAVRVSSQKWNAARRDYEDAAEEAERGSRAYREIEHERTRLERIRRIATTVQELRDAQAARAALGVPAPLPPAASATVETATSKAASANAKLLVLRPQLEEHRDALAKVALSPVLTAEADAITSLAGRVAAFEQAKADLPALQGEVSAKIATVRAAAVDLGWPETEIVAIVARLPTSVIRTEIQALARKRDRLEDAVQKAERAYGDMETELAELDRLIAEAPVASADPALDQALLDAQALNLPTAATKADSKVATVAARLAGALAELKPWTGDAARLREMQPPTTDEIQRQISRRAEAETRARSLRDTLTTKRLEATRAEVAAEDYRRQHDPVTEATVTAQRQRRDALWQRLRQGEETLTAAGDRYEQEVLSADQAADRRQRETATVERAETLDRDSRTLTAEIAELERQREAADDALTQIDRDWSTNLAARGLDNLTVERISAWIGERNQALIAADSLQEAERERDDLHQRTGEVAGSLRHALAAAGALTDPAAELAGLVAQARRFTASQADARALATRRQQERDRARLQLPSLKTMAETAANDWRKWQDAWATKLATVSLPASTEPDGATHALDQFVTMRALCVDIEKAEAGRLAPMSDFIATFAGDAERLAAKCMPEVVGLAPDEIAARLGAGLAAATEATREHTRLTGLIRTTTEAVKTADDEERLAWAEVQPLLEAAKVTTVAELRVAIALADTCRVAEAKVQTAEQVLRTSGDGLPLETLLAEVEAEDLTRLATRLEDVDAARAAAETHRDECIARRTTAEATFRQTDGQAAAVQAEADRRNALLLMGDAADEYVRITIAAKVLQWALDRYREEKQEPLLRRASELFALLTNGSFVKLTPNFDAKPVTLLAHRASGETVPISGFSTGTEDQLYLALRLAALELHLEDAVPLPFVGDDLYVHWDNARAAAGFTALAHLAQRTQVLLFTHEEDLVEVARQATGGLVQVHAL